MLWGIFTALSLVTASEELYDKLPLDQQRDFAITLRKLFVIGDLETPGSLTSLQSTIVEDLRIASSSTASDQEILSQQRSLAMLRTSIADRTFEFRRYILPQIARIYGEEVKALSEGAQDFDSLMTRKTLELKQREFLLRNPFFGNYHPLAGLKGFYVQQFFEVQNLEPSFDLLNRLRKDEPLAFEDYKTLLTLLNPSLQQMTEDDFFHNYAFYSLYARLPQQDFQSFELFTNHLDQSIQSLQIEAVSRGLTVQLRELVREDSRFLWLLWKWGRQNKDWIVTDWKSQEIEVLSGWSFLLKEYETQWPEFARIPEQLAFDEPARKLIADEVDQFVLGTFTAEEAADFLAAIDEFEKGDWLNQSLEESAIRELSENLRRILAARLFPDLSIRTGRALLEGSFFESLSELERREGLGFLFGSQIPPEEWKQLKAAEDGSHVSIAQYHYHLVKTYLQGARAESPQQEFIVLPNGEKIPTVASQRKTTRDYFDANRQKMEFGPYPDWLIEELTVFFYPSLEHRYLEGKRFQSERQRQQILREMRLAQQKLEAEITHASESEEKAKIEARHEEIVRSFQEKLAPYPIDSSSEATWIAAFLEGAMPHSEDTADILKAVGAGAIFAVAVKVFGLRAVAWFVVLDTGVRLVSAGYIQEDLVSLNLDSGFSTPIGYMTAVSLQDNLKLFYQFQSATKPDEVMDVAYDIGKLSSEFVWFGLGASVTRFGLDLSSYQRARRANRIYREMERLDDAVSKTQSTLSTLRSKLVAMEAEWERLSLRGQAHTRTGKRLGQQIDELRLEIFGLEEARLGGVQRPSTFYSKALLSSLVHIAKSIIPTRTPFHTKLVRLKKKWTGRSQLAVKQYAREIDRLTSELMRLEAKEWAWQSRPSTWSEARSFKGEFKNFETSQKQMNLHLEEARLTLERAADLNFEARASLYDAAAHSIKRARVEWVKSREAFSSAEVAAGEFGNRLQMFNNVAKNTHSSLTGSDLNMSHLQRFPRRMRAILENQRAHIDEMAMQIPLKY